jgi:hypothetical protein
MAKEKLVLFVNGRTEKEILDKIISFDLDDDKLYKVLNDYENAQGFEHFKELMSKYFEVK